jgi:AsmA protein
MKSFFKWTAIAAVCLAIVVVVALLLIPKFIDAKQYKAALETYVSETTGRSFAVGDDVGLSLFPWTGVSFSNLQLGTPAGFAEKTFLSLKTFELRIKFMPLLTRKEIVVDHLLIHEPKIFMITQADGRVSWDFSVKSRDDKKTAPGAPAEKNAQPALPIKSLLIGELTVKNGSLQLIDHKTGSRQEISGLNLALRDLSFDRPVQLVLTASMNQKPISVEGRFGPFVGQDVQGAAPLDLKASVFNLLNLRLKGTVESLLMAPRAELVVEAGEFSPRKLLAEIGQSPPDTADPQALGKLAFKAAIRADQRSAAVSDGLLTLDDSKLTITMKARDFSKPDLAFELKLDQIDLDRYLPPKATAKAGQTQPAAAGAPKKTDYTPLRKMILDGTVGIGRLTVNKAKIENAQFKIAARDGVLSLDPFKLQLYQGKAGGKAAVNLSGAEPATRLELAVDNVQANPLLQDLAGKDFIEGAADAKLNVTLLGDTPERLKQSLNGRGDLKFKNGALVGVDLAGMARDFKRTLSGQAASGEKPRTDFSELSVPFTLQNGVFHTTDSLMQSPFIRLQAAGKADLVRETLDFRVEPKVVGTLKGQGDAKERSGLAVPILVSGSFAKPEFHPDLEAMAKGQLKNLLNPSESGESAPAKSKAGKLLKGILPGKP